MTDVGVWQRKADWLATQPDDVVQQEGLELETKLHEAGLDWSMGSGPGETIERIAGLGAYFDEQHAKLQPPPAPEPTEQDRRLHAWIERRSAENAKRNYEQSIGDLVELFIEDPDRASELWDKMLK